MLEGEQGGEATTSGSVLHVALGVWFRGEYGGAGDWVTVRSLPALMTGIHRDASCCHCSVQRLGGKDSGALHPENPSSSPTGPAASAHGCSPACRKGLCTAISLGMEAGRAQSDTLSPSYSFPKGHQISSKQVCGKPCIPAGKSLDYCVTKGTACVLSLPLAKGSAEIQRKAGSINIAV